MIQHLNAMVACHISWWRHILAFKIVFASVEDSYRTGRKETVASQYTQAPQKGHLLCISTNCFSSGHCCSLWASTLGCHWSEFPQRFLRKIPQLNAAIVHRRCKGCWVLWRPNHLGQGQGGIDMDRSDHIEDIIGYLDYHRLSKSIFKWFHSFTNNKFYPCWPFLTLRWDTVPWDTLPEISVWTLPKRKLKRCTNPLFYFREMLWGCGIVYRIIEVCWLEGQQWPQWFDDESIITFEVPFRKKHYWMVNSTNLKNM